MIQNDLYIIQSYTQTFPPKPILTMFMNKLFPLLWFIMALLQFGAGIPDLNEKLPHTFWNCMILPLLV